MLELEGLTRRYGAVTALDGLSFTVAEGTMFGFVGPNGAGKTTAMRIVLGVLEPDSGAVRWRGAPIDAAARVRFGYMPEERGLYPKMRVADQLEYMARLHGFDAAAARGSTQRLIERLGLSERGGAPVEELSLGNQQRVQLGAALVHEPELLVLDEPFSGLDPEGVDVLASVLRERVEAGVAVVFSSHQLELVERVCDAVAIIARGRIVASGSVAELREREARRVLRVEVEGARDGWADGIDGVLGVERDGEALLVALTENADDQLVLEAARRAGRVRHFGPVRATLAEIFRETVAA